MPELILKDVCKNYGKTQAVNNMNLTIRDGEFIALLGPSGCGKTTTLRMIAGLEEITSGEIYLGEKCVNDIPPKDRDMAMVFQDYALYPHMTVFDNIAFGLKMRGVAKEEITERVENVAGRLGLTDLLKRKPHALSGGERQRVALGRAMVRQPKIFLFDEPLSNLDAALRVQMREELLQLHRELKTTFIYVTHDQIEAMTMADRIVVMDKGVMQQCDAPQIVYQRPSNSFVARFIGNPQMNMISCSIEDENGAVKCRIGDDELDIPDNIKNKLIEKECIDKSLVLGIRPEHISLNANSGIKMMLHHYENTGADTYLYFICNQNEKPVIVRTTGSSASFSFGASAELCFNWDEVRFFDSNTGNAIF